MGLFDFGVLFGKHGAGARNAAWLTTIASAAGAYYYADKIKNKPRVY